MSIRSAAKAILIHNGNILLNRCVFSTGETYYDFPGGGQDLYEALPDTVRREVLEETGYEIDVGAFLALAEEVFTSPEVREKYPQYCHRVSHFFLCTLKSEEKHTITEIDVQQTGSVWVSLAEADLLPVYPLAIRGKLRMLIASDKPQYLGCSFYEGSL